MLEVQRLTIRTIGDALSVPRVQRMVRELKLIDALVVAVRAPLFGSNREVGGGRLPQSINRTTCQSRTRKSYTTVCTIRSTTHTMARTPLD